MEKKKKATGEETDYITSMIDNNGADPWVIKQNGTYYYIKVTEGKIMLFSSESLVEIAAGDSTVILEDTAEVYDFWAPELHLLDNVWYVYVAAITPADNIHRMYVLVNENENPMEGTWECREMEGMDDKFAIDGTVLETPSGRYYIWSGWEGYENVQQNLYLAQMISPVQVMEEKILISQPEYAWEMNGQPLINEGPQVLIKKNTINLVYSASGSWTDDYCLGLLTASIDADVKDPAVWKKEKEPIFSRGANIYGPGHNSYTTSVDDKEDIMVFHSARWESSGWNRSIRFQQIQFDADGKILPAVPIASEQLQKLPGGEAKRNRFDYEDFMLEGKLAVVETEQAISGKAVQGFEETSDKLKLTFEQEQEKRQSVIAYVRLDDCYDENNIVSLEVTVNEQTFSQKIYPSEYFQPVIVAADLKKGMNEISIQSEAGGDTISVERIEIVQ